MELAVIVPGKEETELTVSDRIFGCKFNEALVHQVVTAFLAGARAGTKAQKTRAEVRGGGRKPWRQKGTGRARAGTNRSPLWRSGGKTFAAKPRDYSQKVNKKMYRQALCGMLSELVRENSLMVVEDLKIKEPKTKVVKESLKALNLEDVLIFTDGLNNNLHLGARNLPFVEIRDIKSIDPVCLINFSKILMTVDSIKRLEEIFK